MNTPDKPAFNLPVHEVPLDSDTLRTELKSELRGLRLRKAIRLLGKASLQRAQMESEMLSTGYHLGIGETPQYNIPSYRAEFADRGVPMGNFGPALDKLHQKDRPFKTVRRAARKLRRTEDQLEKVYGYELPRMEAGKPKEATSDTRPNWMRTLNAGEQDSSHIQAGETVWEAISEAYSKGLRKMGPSSAAEYQPQINEIVIANKSGSPIEIHPVYPPKE